MIRWGSMQVVNEELVKGKKVLLRYDMDVALEEVKGQTSKVKSKVAEDFKLRAGLDTLNLCLAHAPRVTLIGHLGRPEGKVMEELRVAPIVEWFKNNGYKAELESGKLEILENLRFDPREEAEDLGFAKELAAKGEVYVNEAFSSYHPAASTTVLPTLFPHVEDPEGHLHPRRAAGLRFAQEVSKLKEVRDNPKKPLIAIMGGAKVEDKLPVIKALAQEADAVLVGGKLVTEIREENLDLPSNVLVGKLSDDGLDIAPETYQSWNNLIQQSRMIVWNGPLGKIQNSELRVKDLDTAQGTYMIARMVLASSADVIIGGGDTVAFLDAVALLGSFKEKAFISVGGGAMLKLLSDGTLPTIEALA